MDYLNYASRFQPMNVLPNNRTVIDQSLLDIPIPTYMLDTRRALPSKLLELPIEYSVYWDSQMQSPQARNSSIKEIYKQFVNSWEGGRLARVSGDRGGLTNNGITIGTWRTVGKDKNGDGKIDEQDLALMSSLDHSDILEQRFWNAARADEINNPYLAAYVVDWMWGSGPGAFKNMHKAFGLKPKSSMTQELLNRINSDASYAYNTLNRARKLFYRNIAAQDPTLEKFLRGWLRRADAITLNGMILNR